MGLPRASAVVLEWIGCGFRTPRIGGGECGRVVTKMHLQFPMLRGGKSTGGRAGYAGGRALCEGKFGTEAEN